MKAQANARIQNAISLARHRARPMAWDETSVSAVIAGSTRGGAAEQTVRTPDQDHDHDGVDHERPELGHVILAGDIADAEQERSKKRPGDAGRAADSDHD